MSATFSEFGRKRTDFLATGSSMQPYIMENTRRWWRVSSGGAVQLVHGILKREKTRMKE